ncbi:carbohydrate ABC transporter membrane protein 1 (CUT1 family) [Microbacterium sp. SLBN-154]|uniref:carbohydrate ABC transporter permease n=1 Tax=Microbacterium sp. SLBN-154 TaxID=2768458 RepID=UPI00114EEBC3|nr:sugar ABC transporter permease [Microbacterium sp. SLBN-154]TQK17665.1 carbohydrate ABC transporter membrane protein 1 (CUT1 family) [Microbacterium sp. SLBN-154]
MSTTAPKRTTFRRRVSSPPPAVYALVLIPFLIEAFVVFWPALNGIALSFLSWNGYSEAQFVGFDNYARMATDPVFVIALRNTAIWLVVFGGISFVGGLAVALLLQSERRGVGVYRTALFLPMVFSLVVTALIWNAIYQPSGILNTFLTAIGLESWTRLWLGDPNTALLAVIVAALWRQIGYIMVLFIAGLKAIDPALIEAARVDGANAWQRLRFITLPQLRSVNLVVISILVIDALRSFDIVYSMTRGGPFRSTELLSTYMFEAAFTSRQLGYGSALAVVIFLLAVGVIITYLTRAFADSKED